MSISGILGKANIGALQVRLELPKEVYDGVPTLARVHLASGRRLPAFLIRVGVADASALFAVAARHNPESAPLPITLRGRGRQRLERVLISSIFPINFFIRSRWLPLDCPVTVFPAPRPCPPTTAADGRRSRGEQPAAARGHEGEVSRIGDYRGGEPLKLIHWKLSARHDQLKVKELSASRHEPLIIDLAELPTGSLEERLGCACHLIGELTRQGRPVGLRLGSRLLGPGTGTAHKRKLLTELAVYGQD